MNRPLRRIATGLATVPLFVGCGDDSEKAQTPTEKIVISACGEKPTHGAPVDSESIRELNHSLWFARGISGLYETASMYTDGSLSGGETITANDFKRPEGVLESKLGDVVCASTNGLVYFIDTPSANEIANYSVAVLQEWHLDQQCELNAQQSASEGITVVPNCD